MAKLPQWALEHLIKPFSLPLAALAYLDRGHNMLIAGWPGDRVELEVGVHDRRRHVPIVSLRQAA